MDGLPLHIAPSKIITAVVLGPQASPPAPFPPTNLRMQKGLNRTRAGEAFAVPVRWLSDYDKRFDREMLPAFELPI